MYEDMDRGRIEKEEVKLKRRGGGGGELGEEKRD